MTGTPRSGTSLTAGVLHTLGLSFGRTVPGGEGNLKGYFENDAVRQAALKPALVEAGGDTTAQRRFPRPGGADHQRLRSQVLKRLQGANAYKDCKIALVWESWLRAFPDSLYVIVRRDMDDFAESCLRTSFMQRFNTAEGWKQWGQHFVDCCEEIKQRAEYIEVWPSPEPDAFRELADFAGVSWNYDAVRAFADPSLWNRHKKPRP